MKCTICKINEANQTGSHVFPAWMIASAFDVESRNRDFEIIYKCGAIDSKLPYFGRSVPIEKINELIGRELEDVEVKAQANCLILDNLWCTECESRIKIAEDYFLENIDRSTVDFNGFSDTDSRDFTNVDKYLVRLFIYSLVIRASLSKSLGFVITSKTSNKLITFLNRYLKNNLNDTLNAIRNSKSKEQLLKYPYRLIKVESPLNDSTFVFVHKKYTRPYCFIINKYILQFYGKGNHVIFSPKSFFGISTIISKSHNIRNYKEDSFKLGIFKNSIWDKIKSHYYDLITDTWLEECTFLFENLYKTHHGHKPNEAKIKAFLIRVTHSKYPLGIKYSREKIMEAITEEIKD